MFYKKKLFVVTMTFTVFLMALFTNAQTVIVILKQPPPNQWQVEDMWQLTLTNTSQESCNVYLYGTVEEADAGLIFEGTSGTFELTSGFSGPVNRGDLEPVDVGYVNADYEDIVYKTGTLPEGTYTICIYVKDYETDEKLGYDCIIQSIIHPSPPELINPVDEANVTEELPVFLWLPPMPMGEFVIYNIKLVELLDGQIPIEAMEANPAWFEETEIFSTSIQFPISAREFEQGVTYAWQVTAISGDDWVIGESPVWSFNYEAAEVVIFEEPVSIELISPVNGEVYDSPASQPIVMFEWMPIDTALVTLVVTSEVSYNLTIWQLSEDPAIGVVEGYTPTEEDLSELDPYFVKGEIEGTSCVYPYDFDLVEMKNHLLPGYHYAWRITCWLDDWKIGESEIRSFTCTTGQISTCVNSTWKFENLQPNYDDCKNFGFFIAKAWQCEDGKWVEKRSNDIIKAKKVDKLPDDAQYCDWYVIRSVEWIYNEELKKEESNIIYNTYHRGEDTWNPPIEIKIPKVGVEDDLTEPCKDCDDRFEILENPPEEQDNKVRVKCKKWHCKKGEFVFEGDEYEEFEIVTELPDIWRHCQKVAMIESKPGKRIYNYYHCDHGIWEKIKTIEVGTTIAHIFKIIGRVRVKRAGSNNWIRAKKCMRLREGAIIESQLGAKAYVKFIVDGKRVGAAVIKPLTQMTIKKFDFNKKKVNTTLKIRVGSVRVRVDKTALRTDSQVSTPSMVAGVTGTSFEASHNDATNTSVLMVFDGSMDVTNLKTGDTVVITGNGKGNGQRATVQGDKIIVEDITGMDASPGGEWDFDAMFEE